MTQNQKETERKKIKELKKKKSSIVTNEILRYQRNSFTLSFERGTTKFVSNFQKIFFFQSCLTMYCIKILLIMKLQTIICQIFSKQNKKM